MVAFSMFAPGGGFPRAVATAQDSVTLKELTGCPTPELSMYDTLPLTLVGLLPAGFGVIPMSVHLNMGDSDSSGGLYT